MLHVLKSNKSYLRTLEILMLPNNLVLKLHILKKESVTEEEAVFPKHRVPSPRKGAPETACSRVPGVALGKIVR